MGKRKMPVRNQVLAVLPVLFVIGWLGLPSYFGDWMERKALAAPMTFTVNSTADDVDQDGCEPSSFLGQDCTLREALLAANSNLGLDTITFNIINIRDTNPVKTINVGGTLGALPTITDPVVIDGTTQPGYVDRPLIQLNRIGFPFSIDGLTISAGGSTVKGLAIVLFRRGLVLQGGDANTIQGNHIGIDSTGGVALSNMTGIFISGDSLNNTIGATSGARNVISGNEKGLEILSSGNLVQGNYIGTTASGAAPLGNSSEGVILRSGASSNIIGGTDPAARNVISGNGKGVVLFTGSSDDPVSSLNKVLGNYIGTDVTGSQALGNSGCGVCFSEVRATDNIIGGTEAGARNIISGNNGAGIEISSSLATGNLVQGNYIGTNAAGTAALSNRGNGILIGSSGNTVGGTTSAARNVISGNSRSGVEIVGGSATGNKVQGNYIGTNAAGNADLGNQGSGVRIEGAPNNTIGGVTSTPGAAPGNVISGNSVDGVAIGSLGSAPGNKIQGNLIGTDAQGIVAIGNSNIGVSIANANNLIGGTTSERNVISGNGFGVFVVSTGNKVQGNYIGTDIHGTGPLANLSDGVVVTMFGQNTIGRAFDGSGSGNTIAFNRGNGVQVTGNARANIIRTNSLHSNERLGIDLAAVMDPSSGVTPNDPGDGDDGPNNLQNFPELTSATTGLVLRIHGTLNSTPNTRFSIQLFANGSCDPSGHGEGQTFLTGEEFTTGRIGNLSFTMILPPVPSGQFITATATRFNDDAQLTDTSEFSPCIQVVAPGNLHFSAGSFSVNENGSIATITVTRTGGSDGTVTVNFATSNGTATAGSDYTATSGTLTFGPGVTSQTFTVPITDDGAVEGNETVDLTLSNPTGGADLVGPSTAVLTIVDNDSAPTPTPTPTPTPAGATLQFSAGSYNVVEDCTSLSITVTRVGDTSGEATVNYTTSSGTASDRADFTSALGTLHFAAGETQETFAVLITEDSRSEGTETATITLSNASGASLGAPSVATMEIFDDPSEPARNAIDDAASFACQHYHDFLNRQPDAAGLAFWTDNITSCGTDAQCIDLKRINVSAAFFLSIEFQETGYLVYRMYKAAYGDTTSPNVAIPVPIIRLHEFLPDAQRIGQGVQVGIGDWQGQLEANKTAYAREFVARQRFIADYPLTMTAAQFVDKLNLNAGGVLSPAERDQLIAELSTAGDLTTGRAGVLRKVAEDADLRQQETNRAFVLMQYYGYLRRNPDDPQDTDFRGWEFWLNKLNQFNGNFVQAEMVNAFILSIEYRERFGP